MSNQLATILAIYLGGAAFAQSLRLPDPSAAPPPNLAAPDPFGMPAAPTVTVSGGDDALPSPENGRAMASRVLSGIDDLTGTIKRNQSMIGQLDGRIVVCNRKISDLLAERNRILDDYRHGFFCNQCNKAKSEFPSEAAFYYHIAEGASQGRHVIAATPEQVAAKEQEFKDKIQPFEAERTSALRTRSEKVVENKQAWGQVQEGIYLWQLATTMQLAAIQAREDEAKRRDAIDIQRAQDALTQVEAERIKAMNAGPRAKLQVDASVAGKKFWEDIIDKTQQQAAARGSAERETIAQAQQQRAQDYQQISGFVQRNQSFYGFSDLPKINIPLGDWSVSFDGRMLGIGFKFGKLLSANVTAGAPNATDLEVSSFLEICGKVKIGVHSTTTFNPYAAGGPGTSYAPILTVKQPNDKKAPLTTPTLPERPTIKLPIP